MYFNIYISIYVLLYIYIYKHQYDIWICLKICNTHKKTTLMGNIMINHRISIGTMMSNLCMESVYPIFRYDLGKL